MCLIAPVFLLELGFGKEPIWTLARSKHKKGSPQRSCCGVLSMGKWVESILIRSHSR